MVPSAIEALTASSTGCASAAALRHRDPVGRDAVGVPAELELAARLLDDVRGDGRVGHAELGATARDRQVRAVLVRIDLDVDLALLGLGLGVLLLRRALLDRDRVTAEVGRGVFGARLLRRGVERRARLRVGDEVDSSSARSSVSVNDEMPRSYLPAVRPGRMLSNGVFWTFGVSPMIWPSALEMSASAPITVVLSSGREELHRRVRRVGGDAELAALRNG